MQLSDAVGMGELKTRLRISSYCLFAIATHLVSPTAFAQQAAPRRSAPWASLTRYTKPLKQELPNTTALSPPPLGVPANALPPISLPANALPPADAASPSALGMLMDGAPIASQQLFPQTQAAPTNSSTWWNATVQNPMRPNEPMVPVNINQLMALAIENSAQISIYSEVPLIRESSITEADAAFDWTHFADALWEDTSEPVGSSLTVGGDGDRFKDEHISVTGGYRRRTTQGGTFEASQQFGHQNNNSTFFLPNNQGTTRLSVRYTQPLLRGRGEVYNKSLTVLAKLDTKVARDEFERQLETHLLEVSRAYWALYLERGTLAQKKRLEASTAKIVDTLQSRQHIDAQQTQVASANAALAERRSELIRTNAAVRNAETRLRGLVNAAYLGEPNTTELVPMESPSLEYMPFEFNQSFQTAVQHRSEVLQAMKQIKSGAIRMNMAKHEILPVLNAVTEVYVAGLRGNSNVGDAWTSQFTDGAPSYTIGLQFEVPLGRRAARARETRRQVELRQLQTQYRAAIETVKAEVDVAVREVQTAYDEMQAKSASVTASKREVETIQARWKSLANGNQSAALVLESLLRAQERVTDAEFRLLTSEMTYNLALMNMKRVMGVLVETENITTARVTDQGTPRTLLLSGHSIP